MVRLWSMLLTRRALLAHVAAFGGVAALALDGGLPLWLAIGWALVLAIHGGAVWLRLFVARALEGYVERPPQRGVVITGSLASRVILDFDRGTASKTYGGGRRFVRWLYRLCFQAPFPYTSNRDALDAAMHRRTVMGLLTRYWLGENLVAPVLRIEETEDGRYALVAELVRGGAPRNIAGAKALLRELTARCLESGLPSWQVGYYNPRAIGNLIERDDGSFRIIDLESNLVTPFLPPGAIIRGIRRGRYPSFDDIDEVRLRAYLDAHRSEIVRELGEADARRLFEAVDACAAAQARWFAAEPRIPSRVLSVAARLVDVPAWIRRLRGLAARGQGAGDRFVAENVDAWQAEGLLSAEEARRLRLALADPEVALVLANLGAHLAITVALRFPVGSLVRFGWTAGARLIAEWQALRRHQPARTARRVHGVPVMLVALLPSVGSAAYLAASPLRSNGALEVVAIDRVARRLPWSVYERLHLAALMNWLARPRGPAFELGGPRIIGGGIRARIATLAPRRWLTAAVLLTNAVVLAGAVVLHHRFGVGELFTEGGPMTAFAAGELLAAGAFGMLAFRLFWRSAEGVDRDRRGASFFWLGSGLGLIAAGIEDSLSIHERIADWMAGQVALFPLLRGNLEDLIVIGYAVIGLVFLRVFRHELFAVRDAPTLYLGGVLASAVMLFAEPFDGGPARAIEVPAHMAAAGLLLLAHAIYYLNLRGSRVSAERTEPGEAAASGDARAAAEASSDGVSRTPSRQGSRTGRRRTSGSEPQPRRTRAG